MKIPVRNLFFLLLYAWDRLKEGEIVLADTSGTTDLANLFGRVLRAGTSHVLRRGLDRGFLDTTEVSDRIRGRVNFSASMDVLCAPRTKVVCEADDLSYDVAHNRVLKGALERLQRMPELAGDLRHDLIGLLRRLNEVSQPTSWRTELRRVQLSSTNRFYAFLMDVCRFVFEQSVPVQGGRATRFLDLQRDEEAMRDVFERFVRNFYTVHAPFYHVKREYFRWDATGTASCVALLPRMETDISLTNEQRKIIIDTKYTPRVLQMRHHKRTLRSEHLYQLSSYLDGATRKLRDTQMLEGILLYPLSSEGVYCNYTFDHYNIRIHTLDLYEPWETVHRNLLELVA